MSTAPPPPYQVPLPPLRYETSLYPCLITSPLSLSLCAVTSSQIDLGDVTETNRVQAPKQQRSEAIEAVQELHLGTL